MDGMIPRNLPAESSQQDLLGIIIPLGSAVEHERLPRLDPQMKERSQRSQLLLFGNSRLAVVGVQPHFPQSHTSLMLEKTHDLLQPRGGQTLKPPTVLGMNPHREKDPRILNQARNHPPGLGVAEYSHHGL
jgi:hypothetical protein